MGALENQRITKFLEMSKVLIWSLMLIVLVAADDFPLPFERDFPEVFRSETSRSGEEVYRLPTNVLPIEYDIVIDLYFAERAEKPFSYEGREHIIIQALEDDVTQIVLHSNVDYINSISIFTDGTPVLLIPDNPFELVRQHHFLKINMVQPMLVGLNYTLFISYSSTMNEGPMKRGIWRGWYIDENDVERVYATTHFQPYNARQAFPCWDEPFFKAVFTLHLSRPTSYVGRFSNTASASVTALSNGRIQDNFLPTPKMSSYLVTFLVSESFQVIAEDKSFTPAIRIIGRSNSIGMGNHALNLAVNMTNFFDDYLQMPYATLNPNLMNDHISSPDWASAGTENWGMVSYRELHMFINPRETVMSAEHYSATLISHELAHKWFGNLITCYWWSNTWINEGYASYFGYIATNKMFPQYRFDDHFNNRYLQASLSYDSSAFTEPMNHEVNTPAQVTAHFGTISYSKAASFLRMTVDIMTPETFRKANQYFLKTNAYEPTNQYDLYDAFVKAINEDMSLAPYSDFNFTEYYRTWVNEPGYPILYVNVDHSTGDIALKQTRFFLSPSATPTDQVYPIPITFSTKRNPNFETRAQYVMGVGRMVVSKDAGEEWVIFNNLQHGHYRVDYDTKTWNLIAEALLNDPESIHYLNRAQIVDDVFALMRSEKMTYTFGFNILKFLHTEVNYHVWDPAISGFTWLRNRLRHIPDKHAEFDAFVLSLLEHAIDTLGFESHSDANPTVTMSRQMILHFACMLGHNKCVEESRNRFIALRDRDEWVDVGIRRNVYMSGIKQGEPADFDFLLERLKQSNYANDQLEMLRGLGAARRADLLIRYLQITLTKTVRDHDKATAFNYALLGSPENADAVLQFVEIDIDRIRATYVEDSPARPVHTVLSNLAAYLDEPDLDKYEEWLHSTQNNTAQYISTLSAINSARNNIAWGTANADVIMAAVRGSAVISSASFLLLFVLTVVAIVV